jgi:hypothetical protein
MGCTRLARVVAPAQPNVVAGILDPIEPPASGTRLAASLVSECGLADAYPADKHERIETLEVLVRTAKTDHDLYCINAFLARYFPDALERRPPPEKPEALEEWWQLVGAWTARADFGRDRYVVLPEPAPSIFLLQDLRWFAPLLCAEGSSDCGSQARAFLMQAEQQMRTLGLVAELEDQVDDGSDHPQTLPTDAQRVANCEATARPSPPRSRASDWMQCVTDLVPRVTLVPRNSFRLPETGILSVAEWNYWDHCSVYSVYSLDSGLAVHRVSCTVPAANHHVERWSVSRVDPVAIREAVLFGALLDRMDQSPAYSWSFRVPPGIEVDEEHSFGFRRFYGEDSDVPELWFTIQGVLNRHIDEHLEPDDERSPERRYIGGLLRALGHAGSASCATEQERPAVRRLVNAIRKESSPLSDNEMTELFEQIRCRVS